MRTARIIAHIAILSLTLGIVFWAARTQPKLEPADPQKPSVIEYHPDGKTPKQVTYSDANGRTFFEHYGLDGHKLRVKTVYADWDDERYWRPKSQQLAFTEEEFDPATGESVECRWYHPDGKMYMRSQTKSPHEYNLATFRSDGKLRSLNETKPGSPQTYSYFRKDGTTVWYKRTSGTAGAADSWQVFFDWRGNPCNWTFTREDLWVSGTGISPGDLPMPTNRDSYQRHDGTLSFRQTWYAIWPNEQVDFQYALGQVEVFAADGRTLHKRIRLCPTPFGGELLLRDLEVFAGDGTRTLYSYSVSGKRERVEKFSAKGDLLESRPFEASDQVIDDTDPELLFLGFGMGFKLPEFLEI